MARLPERPLAGLPRSLAMAMLALVLGACIWNAVALEARDGAHTTDIERRLDRGERFDMDLYRMVHARVAGGEDYYRAATDGNREFSFPTRPFVTVRTPLLAWGAVLWGEWGWRVIAALLWGANCFAWYVALGPRVAQREREAAAVLSALGGVAAFIPQIPYSHELVAGLLVSLALPLSVSRWWVGGLLVAVLGVGVRELAFPFLLAWSAVALLARRSRQFAALAVGIALAGIGLWLHQQGVANARLPGDETSLGWHGLFGPSLPLYGIHLTTLLQVLPFWLAGPLGVLPLLGWAALGGRIGTLAMIWFVGFMAGVAIFARQENFYWMGLFVPAYGVGLAFVPRAFGDLLSALRRGTAPDPTP